MADRRGRVQPRMHVERANRSSPGAACTDQAVARKDARDRCMKLHGWHPGSRKLGGEAFDG